MLSFKSLAAAAALATSTVALAAPVATAQAEKVVILNTAQLEVQSKAGKDMLQKLQNISKTMDNELKPLQTSAQSAKTSFETAAKGKTQQQIAADTALKSQYEDLTRKAVQFERKKRTLAAELQWTQRLAMEEYQKAMSVVAKEEMTARGATVILDSTQVLFRDPSADITSAVLAKFDARTPTINVVRTKPPAPKQTAQ